MKKGGTLKQYMNLQLQIQISPKSKFNDNTYPHRISDNIEIEILNSTTLTFNETIGIREDLQYLEEQAEEISITRSDSANREENFVEKDIIIVIVVCISVIILISIILVFVFKTKIFTVETEL